MHGYLYIQNVLSQVKILIEEDKNFNWDMAIRPSNHPIALAILKDNHKGAIQNAKLIEQLTQQNIQWKEHSKQQADLIAKLEEQNLQFQQADSQASARRGPRLFN